MHFPKVHGVSLRAFDTAWCVYLVAVCQDLDDPTDPCGAEMHLLADCRHGHGCCVETLKNAVAVLNSEFVHGRILWVQAYPSKRDSCPMAPWSPDRIPIPTACLSRVAALSLSRKK